MKKRILLIDESLTVQKVVALTLDRERFAITNAKTRSEAMKLVLESPPDLILISDQVAGVSANAFPKEVETWVGRDRKQPALILISGQDGKDSRGYSAVLKKPFAPAALQAAVSDALAGAQASSMAPDDSSDDMRLQKIFNDTFSDEAKLVAETYNANVKNAEDTLINIPAPARRGAPPPQENVAEIWGKQEDKAPEGFKVLGAEDSMVYKAQLEKEVVRQLESYDLEDIVHRLVEKMVPPIVERIAQQRLDQLLKESESFVELKP
jgi:DNA-binding response OmpR family regulator